jgi:hypothetical protein
MVHRKTKAKNRKEGGKEERVMNRKGEGVKKKKKLMKRMWKSLYKRRKIEPKDVMGTVCRKGVQEKRKKGRRRGEINLEHQIFIPACCTYTSLKGSASMDRNKRITKRLNFWSLPIQKAIYLREDAFNLAPGLGSRVQ